MLEDDDTALVFDPSEWNIQREGHPWSGEFLLTKQNA